MARYKATQRGFAGRLIEAGEEFDFNGPKGSWMELLDVEDEEDLEDGGDGNGLNPPPVVALPVTPLPGGEGSSTVLGGDGNGTEGKSVSPLDREGIKTLLTNLKVEFNPRAGTEALQKLLDLEMEKAAK